jgi:small subunit ribosomal protein S12
MLLYKKIFYRGVLKGNPQVRGTVMRVRIATPKKPNSARRPVAKIILINKRNVVAHLPGIGHTLRKHSAVLICGVGARDLPGVRHSCIRGVKDFGPVSNRTKRRSVYGIKNLNTEPGKLRRKFRKL